MSAATEAGPTPDQERAIRAQEALNKILGVVGQLEPADQQLVTDTATRILRLAIRAEHLGPFAMTLASAQMGVDFTAPQDRGVIVDLEGRVLQ